MISPQRLLLIGWAVDQRIGGFLAAQACSSTLILNISSTYNSAIIIITNSAIISTNSAIISRGGYPNYWNMTSIGQIVCPDPSPSVKYFTSSTTGAGADAGYCKHLFMYCTS
jgi:hypothetical protein